MNSTELCSTDEGITDNEKLFRFVVHGVLLLTIGALGLVGNGAALLVLTRPAMRSSISCLLAGLAAADSLLIVTSMLLFGMTAIFPYTGRLKAYNYIVYPFIAPVVFPFMCVAQTTSVYLTLLVTVERWVAVCHPLRARSLCTAARARLYLLGVALCALIYNLPKFLEVRVEQNTNFDDVYCVRATEFRIQAKYVTVYIHWMYLIFMYALPFTALAILNARIVRQVRRAQQERRRLSRHRQRELRLATMLLAVVLVFFVCNLLPLVTNACEVFLGDQFSELDPLVKTGDLLVTFNSSINFVIYVIFGDKFKRVFIRTFCGRCAHRLARRPTATAGDSPEHTRDDSAASCERLSLRNLRSIQRPPSVCTHMTTLPAYD